MSIQPDLTQLTRQLDRLEDELRAARQQLQSLEFSQQIHAPLTLAGGPRALTRRGRNGLAWVLGAAGLALAFGALLAQPEGGALHRYVTVGWGVVAAAVFVTGLVARLRPHRLLGLVGLALCVPRAFTVDLSTPLERIAAFIALGSALLWVGFSYHKFRHLIVDAPEPANETTNNPKTEDKP